MVEITTENMATMIGYISEIFSDLSPLLLLIVGVAVALMFITGIISALKR